jgi:uncharacterized protein YlaI
MSAVLTKPVPLKEYVCPECARRNMRRVLIRAAEGAIVEAYCRSCRYRKVVIVE